MVRIDEMLIDAYQHALSICPNSEIELNLDHMPDDENHLRLRHGNEQLLSISFNNLIDNACKFSENKKW